MKNVRYANTIQVAPPPLLLLEVAHIALHDALIFLQVAPPWSAGGKEFEDD